MVENRPWLTFFTHIVLLLGILIMFFPIYLAFVASTHTLADILKTPMPLLPGSHLWENYSRAFVEGSKELGAPVSTMMWNSLIMALGITIGKIAISLTAAFAVVYFRFPGRQFFFWTIFVTLMLPVEVRILPTYKVISDLGLLNSYTGLILPLIASATATFLFRQFFMSIPDELAEAARVDGAGPMRFFIDILVPMSRTSIAAMFVVLFIYGWNQYLWPLLITTQEKYYTLLIGINRMLAVGDQQAEWPIIMATTLLAMTPPVLVVVCMQRLFVRGMTETEK
ncbi:SN-glycerol-3-phosphate ABC transporter, permease protein [Candidatus Vecturithrix granuli]|uniref:SN-glycerol-3-phosphate ABC transporter, permease protein n=1 Tax=Vecturithrix granuli TaxID=1499967 RepID=A0A0S6WAI2_VECG1|nr:SN-glycerol-3-phosphate ABC transporter, permease protein [Candidatus Vecturithrix granuli]